MSSVEELISEFKNAVKTRKPIDVVRRYIIHGSCYALLDDQYYNLRSATASEFEVHPNEVLVVGSGKLGFSVAPQKVLKPFDENSDIDVVVVSANFFDLVWFSVFQYTKTHAYWPKREKFCNYLLQGWIRPDQLPSEKTFEICRRWWKFFNGLSACREYGDYKIRGALYRSWSFLEGYHESNIAELAKAIEV